MGRFCRTAQRGDLETEQTGLIIRRRGSVWSGIGEPKLPHDSLGMSGIGLDCKGGFYPGLRQGHRCVPPTGMTYESIEYEERRINAQTFKELHCRGKEVRACFDLCPSLIFTVAEFQSSVSYFIQFSTAPLSKLSNE